ncbi:MAG: enoyl-CoA hydratase/isomerase family protein, partial [Proteobacteria bacterium]|nr:enoyl-CoA hydratase/isomerase family protein [Pseudomonadota bacterium]
MDVISDYNASTAVGTLTLNKIKSHNSLTPDFLQEISEQLNYLSENRSMRILLFKANGKSFSTGGDVRKFYENKEDILNYSNKIVGKLNSVMLRMISYPVPILSVVDGIVTGGSMGFVLASDFVIATNRASFTPFYSVVGFSPDGGWTALLPKVLGRQRSAEVLCLNQTIKVAEAKEKGLINQTASVEDLETTTDVFVNDLIKMKHRSIKSTKKLLWQDH